MSVENIKWAFLWLLIPIQKFLQRVGNQESFVTEEQVLKALRILRAGDILLSYESGRPTSWFIKGYYDHAAIVTSDRYVVEAVGDKFERQGRRRVNVGGVRKVHLRDWLSKKDSFAIIRPIYRTKDDKKINFLASETSLYYQGLGYDYYFSKNNHKVYCSELVYMCYERHDPQFMMHIPDGKEILPMDYYNLCAKPNEFEHMFFSLKYEARNG